MHDPLSALLSLAKEEKQARGLIDTPREIQQQPDTWSNTFHQLTVIRSAILDFLEKCGVTGSGDSPDVILAGAGTSDYIGRSLSRLLHQQWGCPVNAVPSTELLTNLDEWIVSGKKYLLISFSRSGDSSEAVAVMEYMLARYAQQVQHLLITCNASGAMAKLPGAFTIKLDDAVNDRGLAMTSSFSNMVVAGQFLAYARNPDRYEPLVDELVRMGSGLLPTAANLAASLAKKKFSRVCFLGTGTLQAVAQESALKVLELNAGKIATLAESFLGVRHGPMSFLNKETLVAAYLSGDSYRLQYELDLLDEIRRKNLSGDILVVAPQVTERVRSATQHVLNLDTSSAFPDTCRAPVDIIAGQLLALFLAIENGITPDTPSEGAISRVVSHVRIYPPARRNEIK